MRHQRDRRLGTDRLALVAGVTSRSQPAARSTRSLEAISSKPSGSAPYPSTAARQSRAAYSSQSSVSRATRAAARAALTSAAAPLASIRAVWRTNHV
jgi:hypothetical protein